MRTLQNKTYIITGASRGIGRAIAIRLARAGASVVAAAKTTRKHPKLPGTLPETVELMEKAGGKGLAVRTDVRFPEQLDNLVAKTIATFGRLDGVIHNAGAISLTPLAETSVKLYDRMHQVNDRAVFLLSRAAYPYLKKNGGHIVTLSPPLNLKDKWLKPHIPYTVSKYSMTLLAMGMALEFRDANIAVNSIWPATLIATAAIEFAVGDRALLNHCRKPDIMADAVYEILCRDARTLTGQALIDQSFLEQCGYNTFESYAYNPDYADKIHPDIFL